MNSEKFYKVAQVWDVSNPKAQGVRVCNVIIKLTESLTDTLLVQYLDGTKSRVNGSYLLSSKKAAEDYVNSCWDKEVTDLKFQIKTLEEEIERVNRDYRSIKIENAPNSK